MNVPKHIGILGSGIIGKNWAMIFASAGYKVIIYDIDQEQLINAVNDIQQQLKYFEKNQLLRGNLTANEQFNLIESKADITEVVKNAFFLQECIPEVLNLKQKLYTTIDEIIENETILSSSTSTFLPSILSEGFLHRNQFIVSHPVNPPYFVPLVEIIPAPWTTIEITKRTRDLMDEVGQSPVVLNREVPGFALNRIQYAIINECFNLVEDGIINVENIDKVMTEGLGMRYAFLGPLETAHLNAEGFSQYCSNYAESMYAVSKTFKSVPKITGRTAKIISEELEKKIPLNKLNEKRKWRDLSLIKLSQLKKKNCEF
ncbi:hypothetical protein PGB90_000713 [Kerria lacca]